MGGRSSSSRINGSANAVLSSASAEQLRNIQALNANNPNVLMDVANEVGLRDRQVEKQIRSAKFTDEGFGDWQMDIDRVGGGQVLDEKGSSRALRVGFMPNNSAYSANAWIYDETGQPRMADLGFFNTRREAQSAIKDYILNQRIRRR